MAENPPSPIEDNSQEKAESHRLLSPLGRSKYTAIQPTIPLLESNASTLGFDPRDSNEPTSASPNDESCPAFTVLSPPEEDLKFCSLELVSPWFPKADPENPRARTLRAWSSQRHVVLASCLSVSVLVFLINLVFLITQHWFEASFDGIFTLYNGDCGAVKWRNTGLHVIINILGTLLLGASNLTLQLVAAPTREEVDKAHSKGNWLDIGVPSLGNLLKIPRSRLFIWCCLAFSSLPIHFLYNSVVFSALATNNFLYVAATEAFLSGSGWNVNLTIEKDRVDANTLSYIESIKPKDVFSLITTLQSDYQAHFKEYQNLTNIECLKAYSNPFVSRPNLIIISSSNESLEGNANNSLLNWGMEFQYPNSIPQPLCRPPFTQRKCENKINENWKIDGLIIDYCLNKPTSFVGMQVPLHRCYLQYSSSLLLVVVVFNALKCFCMLFVIISKRGPALSTLGDAIESFLKNPDPFTKSLGICSKKDILRSDKKWKSQKEGYLIWEPRATSWFHAASKRRWKATIISSLLLVITGFVVSADGMRVQVFYKRSIGLSDLWNMGFGEANTNEIISYHQANYGQYGLFMNTVIANIWQVLLSMLYILHNGLLSCLMVAHEWAGFANERKTLRVSAPQGIQRSSYFISMPLRYGIPIMSLFAAEHWLLSQSAFVIRIVNSDWYGVPISAYTTSGFSLVPCILAFSLSVVIVSIQVLHGRFRKFSKGSAMPLASTCSAAISAACHRPDGDKEAHLLPIQWGDVGKNEYGLGLCSFTTSRTIKAPAQGGKYLGYVGPANTANKPRWRQMFRAFRRPKWVKEGNSELGQRMNEQLGEYQR